ncbi:MAG: HlyD family efflux transporter periplasmic adaptor subunit, partial [Dehalococcoidales bacterium]
ADPNKFEADIMVSEMDILQVKLGGEAWVQVDAMSGLTLPAEVIHISPTSTIQSGVVNYEVKVEVKSLETVMHKRQATISEDFQLREGLTVTVTILVDERTDVLLVPSNAITRRGMEAYIQVVKGDTTEERAVETGVSDWQFTEVIAGLSAGEQVVVPKNTSPTTSTLQPRGPMPFSPPH